MHKPAAFSPTTTITAPVTSEARRLRLPSSSWKPSPARARCPRHPPRARPRALHRQMRAGPLRVLSSTAEQMFLDITPAQAAKLPRYSGDLELIEHSAGSLTSQAYRKRWNRKNELLADAAERASVIALQTGTRSYPQ